MTLDSWARGTRIEVSRFQCEGPDVIAIPQSILTPKQERRL